MAHIGALQAIGQPVPLPLLALGLQALGYPQPVVQACAAGHPLGQEILLKLSRAAQDAHGATLQNDNGALDAPRPDTPPAPPPPPPPAPMDTSEDADAAPKSLQAHNAPGPAWMPALAPADDDQSRVRRPAGAQA